MMWLKIKKVLLKIMMIYVRIILSPSATSKYQSVAYEFAKKIYDGVYCSFKSILFLAGIKLAIEIYDTLLFHIFYYIGFFAWSMYLFTGMTYLTSGILERYTKIDLESVMTRLIFNSLVLIFSFGFGILGPKIIVAFVNAKFLMK